MTADEIDEYNSVESWFMNLEKEKSKMFREDKLKEIREEYQRFKQELLAELPPEERMAGLRGEALAVNLSRAQREELKKFL